MPQYLVGVMHGAESRHRSREEMTQIIADVDAVNDAAMADGSFVFAGGLHGPEMTTTVDPRSGTPVLSDGPFAEAHEYLGGFWIIEVADGDAALDFARRASVACREILEVRPFMAGPPEVD